MAIACNALLSPDPFFKLIWHWKGLERIKLFLWLVAIESLHTNAFRVSCHLMISLDCSHYYDGLHETIPYYLRDCSILGDFWHRLVPRSKWPDFFTASFHSWLLSNLVGCWLIEGQPWGCVFGFAIHFLWRIRNKELFQHTTPSPSSIYNRFCHVFQSNLILDCLQGVVSNVSPSYLSFISWLPPPSS